MNANIVAPPFIFNGVEYRFVRTARVHANGAIVIIVNPHGKLEALTQSLSDYLKLAPYDLPEGLKESLQDMDDAEREMLDLEDRLEDARAIYEEEQEKVRRIFKEAFAG